MTMKRHMNGYTTQIMVGATDYATISLRGILSMSITCKNALKARQVFKYEIVMLLICPLKNNLRKTPYNFSFITFSNLDFTNYKSKANKAIRMIRARPTAPMNRNVVMLATKLVDFIPDDSTTLLTLSFVMPIK